MFLSCKILRLPARIFHHQLLGAWEGHERGKKGVRNPALWALILNFDPPPTYMDFDVLMQSQVQLTGVTRTKIAMIEVLFARSWWYAVLRQRLRSCQHVRIALNACTKMTLVIHYGPEERGRNNARLSLSRDARPNSQQRKSIWGD